jgi:hypothetical protein
MQPNSDLIELLAALNAAGADYLLIDAYALAFHGYPRATKDADISSGPTPITRVKSGTLWSHSALR